MKKRSLYTFYHIHKSGGTTFTFHIRQNFGPSEYLQVYLNEPGQVPSFSRQEEVEDYLNALPEEAKERLRIIYGHHVYRDINKHFDRPIRYFTIMRDPIERMVSHYNDEMSRLLKGMTLTDNRGKVIPCQSGEILPFEDWLVQRQGLQDYLTRTFNRLFLREFMEKNIVKESRELLIKAKRALDEFYFVGTIENYKSDADFIYNKLGIKKFYPDQNVSVKYLTLNGTNRHLYKLIMDKSPLDLEFYEYARDLNRKRKRSLRQYWYFVFQTKLRRRYQQISKKAL